MPYRLSESDPAPGSVVRLTIVPFRSEGTCVAALTDDALAVPTGDVRPGESWDLDAALRIPMDTMGFRRQRTHVFAVEDLEDGHIHVYAWAEGDAAGDHEVRWFEGSADEVADRLDPQTAAVVRDAARSFAAQDDAGYYADNLRLLEPAYLRGTTPQQGSGSGSDAAGWRQRRQMIVDGIHRTGSFLDVGCANGLLMESVRNWAAERGLSIEPYGIDLSPRLVELARQRLPEWADRIEVGNAIDYVPASGRRFTFVHVLEDSVPPRRRRDLVEHALAHLVEPHGRLLFSRYRTSSGPGAADELARLGYRVGGHATSAAGFATTAWIDA
jgi:2-polyprenyl-3-methyl-5-hydroxy-6-metoxy-1,4-benzoquinol methylase